MTQPQSTFNEVAKRSLCDVQLRAFPHPYRAMMAICSDLDETPNREVYAQIARFLNTTDTTPMGPGVGLEVGNTIYFDMPSNQFAYWNTDEAGREMVWALIRSGHIDCLHSYGDLARTRRDAGRALEELTRHDCKLEVWIDHGTAPTNFDPDIMQGHGDEIGHAAYHADLTTDYGIQYIWRGRVTSVTGQDVPAQMEGILTWKHPVASGRTWLKELAKRSLARTDNAKYAMHGPNEIVRSALLRDGRQVQEFMRCNPHWGGVSSCEEGRAIGEVLTDETLGRLTDRGGLCLLYTHLGKIDDPKVPFNSKAVAGFRRLAGAFGDGRILVTTTRRLLGYRRAVRQITWVGTQDDNHIRIAVDTRADGRSPDGLNDPDLAGLTFYVSDPEITSMTIDGRDVAHLEHNAPDHTGQASVSLPWPQLEFPPI